MVQGITVIGVIEGDGNAVLAATMLAIDGASHRRTHGERFVVRLDDDKRVTVNAKPLTLAVVPAKPRKGTWGDLASDPRAALFSDVAPGDHVDVELAGWVLVPGQRVAVRGTIAGETLAGGGPREPAVAEPSVIDGARVAIVTDDDAHAIGVLDAADAQERREAEAKQARERAKEAALRERTPRPLQRWILALAVLALALVFVGLACWRGVAAATAGRNTSVTALVSFLAFAIAHHVLALLLVGFVVRPPFEAARCGEPDATLRPPWDNVPLFGWFFLVGGALLTGSTLPSVAFNGTRALAFSAAYCALGSFFFLWWGYAKHRDHRRLARLLLRARPQPSVVEGQFGLYVGTVAADAGGVIERSITWRQRKSVNQSTHGPNAGQVSRWTEGTPQSSADNSFTIQAGGASFVVETAKAQWGAPFTYEPGGVVRTRAEIRGGNEVLVLARLRSDNATLVARSTGPESLVLFGAPDHARATLVRLARRWWVPAGVLAAWIAASVASCVWLAV